MRTWRATMVASSLMLAAVAGCSDEHSHALNAAPRKPVRAPEKHLDAGHAPTPDAAADAGFSPIIDFVAAQAYHDFPSLELVGLQRAHKFETLIDKAITPSQIESLRVLGPNGFVFEFAQQPFADSLNGYIYNDKVLAIWYQALELGELEDGRYTLDLVLKNGEHAERARDLVTNTELVDFYLAHKAELQFTPNSGSSPADDTVLRWTTFHELGGPDAYYNAWISPGTDESVAPDGLRGDTIFDDAVHDPNAGLNRSSSRQGSKQDPLPIGPQTWQPEIVDANVLEEINQIIFPPGQHFDAE